MRVKIGNTMFESKDVPICVYLEDEEVNVLSDPGTPMISSVPGSLKWSQDDITKWSAITKKRKSLLSEITRPRKKEDVRVPKRSDDGW